MVIVQVRATTILRLCYWVIPDLCLLSLVQRHGVSVTPQTCRSGLGGRDHLLQPQFRGLHDGARPQSGAVGQSRDAGSRIDPERGVRECPPAVTTGGLTPPVVWTA